MKLTVLNETHQIDIRQNVPYRGNSEVVAFLIEKALYEFSPALGSPIHAVARELEAFFGPEAKIELEQHEEDEAADNRLY